MAKTKITKHELSPGEDEMEIEPPSHHYTSVSSDVDSDQRPTVMYVLWTTADVGSTIGNTTPDIERAVRKAVDGDRERTSSATPTKSGTSTTEEDDEE